MTDDRDLVSVPVEPTLEMLRAGREAYLKVRTSGISGMTIEAQIKAECARERAAYQAMINEFLRSLDSDKSRTD